MLDFNFFARLHSFLESIVNSRLRQILPILITYRRECFKKTSEENEYREAVINIIYARPRLLHAAEAYALFKLDLDYPMYRRSYDAFLEKGDVGRLFPREEKEEEGLVVLGRVDKVQLDVPFSPEHQHSITFAIIIMIIIITSFIMIIMIIMIIMTI